MKDTSAPPDRRRQILDGAFACFLEKGYRATSMADIRARSGASTGSIYHFFSGKGGIAQALLREAVNGWSEVSAPLPDDAETGIRASVHGLVAWGLANPGQLRFMEEVRSLAPNDAELAGIRDMLADGQAAGATRFAAWQAAGKVRKLPFAIAHALMLGPAYSYLRLAPPTPPGQAERIAALFADAAWQAVRA